MPARDKQIGQGTGHKQAMGVLVEPAIAHLDKTKDPLDDPAECSHFGLGAIFRPLDLVHNTSVAVATIGEIASLGGVLPDHPALAAVGLIAPHPGLVAM